MSLGIKKQRLITIGCFYYVNFGKVIFFLYRLVENLIVEKNPKIKPSEIVLFPSHAGFAGSPVFSIFSSFLQLMNEIHLKLTEQFTF